MKRIVSHASEQSRSNYFMQEVKCKEKAREEGRNICPSFANPGKEVVGGKETHSLVDRRLVADFTPIP